MLSTASDGGDAAFAMAAAQIGAAVVAGHPGAVRAPVHHRCRDDAPGILIARIPVAQVRRRHGRSSVHDGLGLGILRQGRRRTGTYVAVDNQLRETIPRRWPLIA